MVLNVNSGLPLPSKTERSLWLTCLYIHAHCAALPHTARALPSRTRAEERGGFCAHRTAFLHRARQRILRFWACHMNDQPPARLPRLPVLYYLLVRHARINHRYLVSRSDSVASATWFTRGRMAAIRARCLPRATHARTRVRVSRWQTARRSWRLAGHLTYLLT